MSATTINLKISGMSCEHCASTVKNLIRDERGVETVEVSLENKTVEVHGKDGMNKEYIVNAVNLSGVYHAQ
ncbi:MAG: copper chaperone CopZ [Saprospiraceae bacterium]|jgi:copper chaperone CopZ